jgi:predicted CDP-diglyceride synthetase/phosphatidate cytidylyltransferase
MITTPGLPQYGALVVVGLIAFLSLKEILSASEKWNRSLNSSFNLVILPLMLCFAGIVFFKISEIILP